MKARKRFFRRLSRYTKGWLLTDPLLFAKKDAAYPDNPEDIIMKMNKLMVKKEYFRNPDLTIEQLCRETNTNRSYLSRSIHRMYGTNFCEWVNLFRIEAAKRRISEMSDNRIDLEDLAMECGFNSIRSFSRVFRARESCTPRQFFYKERQGKDHTKYL
ncbi:MAG: AraC family transcriptional regulator [Bacteroidales bacterium]|jgi:AraC-like DNA-binding protein|nr:AraC family transcriptional regulator [Bacteroidales bacterium]MDD2264406.1 AraC family transcriptional regulator [Bacteroidales bacterium]MDD2831640.1 AraC family transcriptional regulator [Bacteroidales bacterium]MDD3209205.1 AraC family transcriptional regulator [Bacteroidales bacterium]MDD3697510.1 AraC family transcriptional regulator [Bacteroidales bacterium]